MSRATGRAWVAGAVLVVAVLACYAPAYRAGYIVDDDNYVTENTTLRSPEGLFRIWFEIGATPQYYPLLYTTFWLEWQAWQDDPAGYHVVNVLLHAANALLVWFVLRMLGVRGAWVAAAVFALHPVHVESVAWIAERKNVLSTLFYLVAAIAYLRYAGIDARASRSPDTARSKGAYVLAFAGFAAALFSKTATVSLPAALLLVVVWKRGRPDPRRDVLPLAPFFALGLALALVTIRIETTTGGAHGALWDLSWVERVLVAGRAFWFYLWKLIWPVDLSFIYRRWTIDAAQAWAYLYPLAALALVSALIGARRRIGAGPLVAVLFFAGTLAPTLGFFNVYFFRYAYVADHFQYVASIGPIALAVSAATWASRRFGRSIRRASAYAGGVVLVLLAATTFVQARTYQSLETLMRDVLEHDPTSWLANNSLGNIHMQHGELDEAVHRFEIAIATAPDYIESRLNMAIAEMNRGRFEDAEPHARRAIELSPRNFSAHKTLGDLMLRAGRPEEALAAYLEALRLRPQLVAAELGAASALAASGRLDRAIPRFRRVLDLEPDNVTALANLGVALARSGRPREALEPLERALALEPTRPGLSRNLEEARRLADPQSTRPRRR